MLCCTHHEIIIICTWHAHCRDTMDQWNDQPLVCRCNHPCSSHQHHHGDYHSFDDITICLNFAYMCVITRYNATTLQGWFRLFSIMTNPQSSSYCMIIDLIAYITMIVHYDHQRRLRGALARPLGLPGRFYVDINERPPIFMRPLRLLQYHEM